MLLTNTLLEAITVLEELQGLPTGVVPGAGVRTSPPTITGELFTKTFLELDEDEDNGAGELLHAPVPPVSFPLYIATGFDIY